MASTATATHQAAPPSPREQVLTALEDARERTLALVSHLSEEQIDGGALLDHEPARVGSRPHRRV